MQRIAVIGGGIAGLRVALRRAQLGDQVALFEARPQLGGQLVTETSAGFVVEHGAEGFVARSEALPKLAADLGIADSLVDQLEQTSFSFDGEALTALAPGEAARRLGFQVQQDELGRGIRSFLHGMAELPRALEGKLAEFSNVKLHLGCPVRALTPQGRAARLTVDSGASEFDAVFVATTAKQAAQLLGPGWGAAARALHESPVTSSLTVSLGFERAAIGHSLAGSGFIVPRAEALSGLRAVAFSSSKLPNRAPPGHALLRLFFRPSDDALASLSDPEWAARAEAELGRVLLLDRPAVLRWVSRWPHALPVFDDAHRARIASLECALEGSSIWLAGSAFHGAGIDAAIRSAERLAHAL